MYDSKEHNLVTNFSGTGKSRSLCLPGAGLGAAGVGGAGVDADASGVKFAKAETVLASSTMTRIG